MKKYLLLIIALAALFHACSDSAESEYEEAKAAGEIYPEDSIVVETEENVLGTTDTFYINKAYLGYPYKKFAPDYLYYTISVPEGKSDSIADIFIDAVKSAGVVHEIAQVRSAEMVHLYFYAENGKALMLKVKDLDIPFTAETATDPEWKLAEEILK